MENKQGRGIVLQHLIDMPSCDCVFCSAQESSSGRKRLFLIFNERRRIYVRNGIKDTWDELTDEIEYNRIRETFNEAIMQRSVPCFSID